MAKYLYNDIELPALPEYDKTTYPYAFIGKSLSADYYSLYLSAQPFTYYGTKSTGTGISFVSALLYRSTESGWDFVSETTNKFSVTAFFTGNELGKVVWTNYDIVNENDNSVYFSATDPVPVLSWSDKTPYRRMNNQWVKQDTYKRVNGEWVKQDEFRRES